MRRTDSMGHVQFTVDTAQIERSGVEVVAASQRMQSVFAESGISATWAVHEQDRQLLDQLAVTSSLTDIALQAPPFLVQLPTNRVRFENWLSGALAVVREYTPEVVALYLPCGDVADVTDILIRSGIRLVCMPTRQRGQLSNLPCTLRPGLVRVALTTAVPGWGRVLGVWDPGFRAKAALAHSIRRQSSQQIAISIEYFLGASGKPWRVLESLLQHVRRAVEAGKLQCETLSEAATRMVPVRARQPMQSILRAA